MWQQAADRQHYQVTTDAVDNFASTAPEHRRSAGMRPTNPVSTMFFGLAEFFAIASGGASPQSLRKDFGLIQEERL